MSIKTTASYLLIGLAALLPRIFALDLFLTGDEANFWIHRSHDFLGAITRGDWAATAISTHPGVTTMWLGAAGIVTRRALLDWGLLDGITFSVALTFFRLPPVLVHVAGVLLGYLMLRRLLPRPLATLAALLWATDPFFVGYSRLLHVDALAGTFATLSLLAICCYLHPTDTEPAELARRPRWLILSGVCAGLAFLSKSPALVLLPSVALIVWLADWRRGGSPWPRGRTVAVLAGWGLVSAVTVFALWPALWANPMDAYAQLQLGVLAEGAQPHETGNFFLGRRDEAPGLAYYPTALPLRLTPWALLGLLALPFVWRRAKELCQARPTLAALAGFAVLFIAAMSVFPKKFDRYLIPTAPALSILAAAGLIALASLGARRAGALWRYGALIGIVGALNLATLAWWHPYNLIYFSQLFGGTPTGAQTFKLGWGEGLNQVADWLNQQPDITGVAVTSERTTVLNPFLRTGAQADYPVNGQLHRENGYVVVYVTQVQGGTPAPPFDRFYRHMTPLHTVRRHGVDYAWIYQVPPPVAHERAAGFGAALELRGFDQAAEARRGQALALTLQWAARAAPEADYWLFAH
ncbi:MAG: phospholipid carrier-dependent glycosyltransferase, partial [Chloroflexales bacterium]|nr:phospholipid carrier-dependent glycosyltransferase [Chloroflexales bacterium]